MRIFLGTNIIPDIAEGFSVTPMENFDLNIIKNIMRKSKIKLISFMIEKFKNKSLAKKFKTGTAEQLISGRGI